MSGAIPITSAKDFAVVMRSRRLAAGVTQDELAQQIGKSRKWVISVERGDTMPTLPAVIAVARALGHSLELRPHDPVYTDLLALALGEA